MKTIFLKGLCGLSLVMIPEVVLSSSKDNLKSVSPHQYTHLIETYQSQTFEPLSQTALFSEQSASVSSFIKVARVHFLTNDGGTTFSTSDAPNFIDTTIDKCKGLGYALTSCTFGNPANICPYNSSYFEECCDAKYKYSPSQCQYPYSPSDVSCGGKYECVCDKSLFPITASSCEAPMIASLVSGNSCVENGIIYVSECVCPSNYTETCSGNHLQGKGSGCTKNGETKYTSCECESGYNLTCSDNGPLNSSDFCLKDGVKYYKECEAAYKGCPTGSVDLDNYWCNGALKCVIK